MTPKGREGVGEPPTPIPLLKILKYFSPTTSFKIPHFRSFSFQKHIYLYLYLEKTFINSLTDTGGGGCQGGRFLFAVFFLKLFL